MATYQDFSLIKNEVEFVQKRNKIDDTSKAFIFMVLENLYPEMDDPVEYITDGGMDFGIDAYYIDETQKTINLFQFKYTKDFNNAKKKNGIKEKEVNDLILKMQKIWDKEKDLMKKANSRMKEAAQEIWRALEKGFTDTKIYLISNYENTLNGSYISDVKRQVESKFRAELKVLSLDDLSELVLERETKPVNIALQLKGKNYFEDSTGDIRALIAEINALNFLQSIVSDDGKLREDVFNENVRVYLKLDTKINKQIYSSIESNENYKFFYYNNGITAICDSFKYTPSDSPVINLENFQVVNGGQTMHSIYEAYRRGLKDKIANIYLLLRIYEVKNRNVGQEIARYTNTQNPVKNRDIMSNDSVQVKLQKELRNRGFYYERKKYEYRNQDFNDNKKIDAEKLGQSILAFYLDKPGSAKNKKQEIFGDFYNDIFSEDRVNADYALLPYLLYQRIEIDIRTFSNKIRELERNNKKNDLKEILSKDGFLVHAHYYLLFTLRILAESKNISLNLDNVDSIFNLYDEAKSVLRKIVDSKKASPTFSVPHLFKSDDLVQEIKSQISKTV